jgi:N-methylhydantoinase A/oxoprolinase/acetone carboxylase beta subunit
MNVIGVDVGGTNTDAVRLSDGRVAAWAKVPTTPDIETGLLAALAEVRGTEPIARVHVGTTAFTNALIERRQLETVAAIRVGAPVSESLPPMIDWPRDLRTAVANPVFFVRGGREYDGRPIRPLGRAEIARVGEAVAAAGITQAAVTAVFATSYPDDEIRIADWLQAIHPRLGVSLSPRIGRFGISYDTLIRRQSRRPHHARCCDDGAISRVARLVNLLDDRQALGLNSEISRARM